MLYYILCESAKVIENFNDDHKTTHGRVVEFVFVCLFCFFFNYQELKAAKKTIVMKN